MTASTSRAAQYVRMSTDHQRYSIDNQLAAIGLYAESKGYQIVRTYADEGCSGLDLAGRAGLQRLLEDAHRPDRPFDLVLVYDVSRWGRFQDVDEGAYYEHLCKRAGLRIVYCAEPFENDGSPLSSVVKALKRAMAAEYSRELSVRIAAGQYRTVLTGYHRGGRPGMGLRRVLLDDTGHVRRQLELGQEKHLRTDRVVRAPGPEREIALVRRIFEMFVLQGLREAKIAERLNQEGIRTPDGAIWREPTIRGILTSERNIGTAVHGRVNTRLKSPSRINPPELWLRVPNAFPPIVPEPLFEAAQLKIATRGRRKSDDQMLADLKALWAREGRLSAELISADPGVVSLHTYYGRFGSLTEAYERIGYYERQTAPFEPKVQPIEPMLEHLRSLLRAHGRLSRALIDGQSTGPKVRAYEWSFGSLGYAYRLIGYKAKGGRSVEPSEWRRAFVESFLPAAAPLD